MKPFSPSLSRRQFVASTAVAAAAPMMLTGRSWAQATANETYGAILIGAGKRGGDRMLGQFLNNNRMRVLGIAEVDTTRREHYVGRVNQHYGNTDCLAVNDYRDILDRADVDIALIFTPDHWHTIPAMQAALLGKHIYCEKPLTLNIRESQQIIAAQRVRNVTFQTGSQQRTEFGGKFVTACEYVMNGRLGACNLAECGSGNPAIPCDLPTEEQPAGLDWDLWQGQAPARGYNPALCPRGVHTNYPNFRAYEEYAGGPLADFGAHMFDIAQWAFGKDRESPVTVVPGEGENATHGTRMVYADGKTIVHVSQSGVKFIGERGFIHVDRGSIRSEPASILEEPLTDTDVRLPRHNSHLNNFLDCIGTDNQPIADVEIGSRTATLCHLANISYDVREELTFDGDNWRFTNSEAANARVDNGQRRAGFELPTIG